MSQLSPTPLKERNKIYTVTRQDEAGETWRSTIAAPSSEEAIQTVTETDNEFGPHQNYTAEERTTKR